MNNEDDRRFNGTRFGSARDKIDAAACRETYK
jgi:hypothetical protein